MAKRKMHPLTLRILIEIGVLVTALIVILVMIGNVWASIGSQETPDKEQTPVQSQPEDTTPPDTTPENTMPPDATAQEAMAWFMEENGLTQADYPTAVLECYEKSAKLYGEQFEARDFLLNYPMQYGVTQQIDISGTDRTTVPLFLQWDDRWGYVDYGKNICGISGCGPTSLAMVAYYLTGDAKYTPVYMMEFATEGKHVGASGGTNWSLFNQGAVELGFTVEELPAVESRVARRLEAGIPVVVNVKEGKFTTGGHYMVLVGYEDGKFRINDPNCREYSARLWDWDDFVGDVKNFWAISLPQE